MDKQKADELIFSYIRKIFGFAMLKLSKIDEAEELAAEITFQVYSSLLRQDTVENPDGYIFRIAQNVYVRHIDVKNLLPLLTASNICPTAMILRLIF